MKRQLLKFTSVSEACKFVDNLNEKYADNFVLINEDESLEADPRTYLGIVYALSEFKMIYLINKTNDGMFPELDI